MSIPFPASRKPVRIRDWTLSPSTKQTFIDAHPCEPFGQGMQAKALVDMYVTSPHLAQRWNVFGLGSIRALACRGWRPRRPHPRIFTTSYRIGGKQSARAPTATREGAYAPRNYSSANVK